jgi:xanthine dehydrogenase YagS FAD-binding subunit
VNEFQYAAAKSVADAIDSVSSVPQSRFIAGGTGMVDLMKLDVETPQQLIDVHRLPLADLHETDSRGLRIGAMMRNSAVAYHPLVQGRYPLLADALLAGASAQLRNMATVGGNLMQRTRCTYFRDVHAACNKRSPGSGCGAIEGFNRMHAVLGTSDSCIATHPSDMSVALACLDATIEVEGPGGQRTIPFADFHKLPKDTPHIETALASDELITAVILGRPMSNAKSLYCKVRDRASYEFALVSVAAVVELSGDTIANARIAFGGVATKPWRSTAAENALQGAPASESTFRKAAAAAVEGAVPRRHNGFKIELLKRTFVRTLTELTGVTS